MDTCFSSFFSIFQFPKINTYCLYDRAGRVVEFNKIKVQADSCSLPAPSYYTAPQLSAWHHSKNTPLWQGGGRSGHFQLPFFLSTLTYVVIQKGELTLIECSLGHPFTPPCHPCETGNIILILRLKKLTPSGFKALSPDHTASQLARRYV